MDKILQNMFKYTNMFPWYWISYGDKTYAYAVVEAFPLKETDSLPEPGTELKFYEPEIWVGENNTAMLIESEIAIKESQDGGTICPFIAKAHASLFGEHIKKQYN